ncbi:phage replisome organizer N-terminal domain-containing protein [Fredinandcohnia sp. 179-A 10B2 NHS]|uniref:phage replisome organizer N-terminal domain-containing protein n=1 Tax=Fredinandcohnia sp. 179-A 10B2 NHS TaxID=3235176 RepID=UPI0039A0AE57
MKWIKLSTHMFEDEKIRLIEQMPEADTILIIWIKLLSQAGKTNASGYIFLSESIPYTEEMLATIFNRPINTVRLALSAFKNFGMIDIDDNSFISIRNWEKHQNIEGLERIREQNRLRKQKERERKRLEPPKRIGHVTVTQSHATEEEGDIDKEEDIDKEIDKEEVEEEQPTPTSKNCFVFYENNFGQLNSHLTQKINAWLDDFSNQHEIIIKAMEITIERNKRSWGYVESILRDWYSHNAKTIKDIEAYEVQKRNQRSNTPYGKKPIRKEVTPEWLGNQEQVIADNNSSNFEEEKRKFEERLKKMKSD